MKTANDVPVEIEMPTADAVSAFLIAHPEFLVEHPDVLASISVPHQTGASVSLVERQASQLRVENREIKRQLNSLVSIARDNEALSRKLHALTLRLINECAPDDLMKTLCAGLREDFQAQKVVVRVFADSVTSEIPVPEFVGVEAAERKLLTDFIVDGRPFCGRLAKAEYKLLFDEEPAETGSAVLLPLSGRGWDGLLVVASDDPSRYSPEMGIELLSHMADITSLVIAPWVQTAI